MNRFQILKGIEPPPPNDNGMGDNSLLISADGKVIGRVDFFHPNLFPEEALTTVNGQRGWLNKNGTFYPEDDVKKELEKRNYILGNIKIIPGT
jgi:hypothetical protein